MDPQLPQMGILTQFKFTKRYAFFVKCDTSHAFLYEARLWDPNEYEFDAEHPLSKMCNEFNTFIKSLCDNNTRHEHTKHEPSPITDPESKE